jgi:tripartite-type tricarboxylate transporter receptor subunit TctC
VVGGRAQLAFVPTAGAGVYLKDARVRIIATTALKRAQMLPQVPTIAEAGLPRFQFESWFGLLAPSATPPAVVEKLNAAVNKAIGTKEVAERLLNFGIEPSVMPVAEFNKLFLADRDLMTKVVKDSGVTRE